MEERYYKELLIAFVRARLTRLGKGELLGDALIKKPIYEMDEDDLNTVVNLAVENEIKIYPFKRSEKLMPRVHKALGFLRGICFDSLLDVGSGRGAFLFPFISIQFFLIPAPNTLLK